MAITGYRQKRTKNKTLVSTAATPMEFSLNPNGISSIANFSIGLMAFLVVVVFPRVGHAAEDDHEVVQIRLVGQQFAIQESNLDLFDSWTYGTHAVIGRCKINSQILNRIAELTVKFGLTNTEREKLRIAARVEASRHYHQIDVLRRRYDSAQRQQLDLQFISSEARQLQQRQFELLETGSFFSKVSAKILTEQRRAEQQAIADRIRHRSNIDTAIRDVERHILLGESQRKALLERLLTKLPLPEVAGDYDDVVVRYRISQLPREVLKPMFDDEQWPGALKGIEGFQELGPVLIYHKLIKGGSSGTAGEIGQLSTDDPGKVME